MGGIKTHKMGYAIKVQNGIVCMATVNFSCPGCGYDYTDEDYEKQLLKSKRGLVYKRCKGCGEKIGITTDITGDVAVWLKKDEQKSNQ